MQSAVFEYWCFFLNFEKTGDSGIEVTVPERLPFSYPRDRINWCSLTVRNRLGSMCPGAGGIKVITNFCEYDFFWQCWNYL